MITLTMLAEVRTQLDQVRTRQQTLTDPAEVAAASEVAAHLSELLALLAHHHAAVLPKIRRLCPPAANGWANVGGTRAPATQELHYFVDGHSLCGRPGTEAEHICLTRPGGTYCPVCVRQLRASSLGGRRD